VNAASKSRRHVRPVDGADELATWLSDRAHTIVLGPGGGVGQPMREMVLAALAGERAVVARCRRADELAEARESLFARIKARRPSPTVLLRMKASFVRLFSGDLQEAEITSKCGKTKAAADASGAIVLLKGSDTVVASPKAGSHH